MATKKKTPETEVTRVITTSNTVRIEAPKGRRRQRKSNVTVLVAPASAVTDHVNGFVDFLREHAVVGLAVGFVIATQVQGVVKQLIASIIDPMFSVLFNGQNLSAQQAVLHFRGRSGVFTWGQLVYTLIDFLFIVLVIYVIIKLLKLDKLDKPKA